MPVWQLLVRALIMRPVNCPYTQETLKYKKNQSPVLKKQFLTKINKIKKKYCLYLFLISLNNRMLFFYREKKNLY